jgi:hypothetical protein
MADPAIHTPFVAQMAALAKSNFIHAGKYYIRKFYSSENSWGLNPGPLVYEMIVLPLSHYNVVMA